MTKNYSINFCVLDLAAGHIRSNLFVNKEQFHSGKRSCPSGLFFVNPIVGSCSHRSATDG